MPHRPPERIPASLDSNVALIVTRETARAVAVALIATLAACATKDVGSPVAPQGDPSAGVLTLPGGQRVWIYPDALNYSGAGSYRWPDGHVFEGDFVHGQRHGTGREVSPDGEIYQGGWRNDKRHGSGTLILADGRTYEGGFEDGVRSGHGVQSGPSGTYDGAWADDQPHGRGVLVEASGGRYEGDWAHGRRQGYGEFTDAAGNVYQGDWAVDTFHGQGEYVTARVRYDGGWDQGQRSGYGRLEVAGYLTYEGTWLNNRRHGYGEETQGTSGGYRGQWREDARDGSGRAWAADGSFHEGQWEQNLPVGPGTRRDVSGIEIDGAWTGNHAASGILRLPSGKSYAGPLFDANPPRVEPALIAWLTARLGSRDPYVLLLYGNAHLDYTEPEPDRDLARRSYEQAARLGLPEAQFRLAGLLIDSEPGDAVDWLTRAADAGHVRAAGRLGEFFHLGDHVVRDHARAIHYYDIAVAGGDEQALNNLAWLLATSPDAAHRDARRAVTLIEPIARYTGDWQYLDTLAAAHAEAGAMDRAVTTQQEAIASLAQANPVSPSAVTELRSHLEHYQRGQPFREVVE